MTRQVLLLLHIFTTILLMILIEHKNRVSWEYKRAEKGPMHLKILNALLENFKC